MNQPTTRTEIPSHVPAELVRDCALLRRGFTFENPFETMVPEIHRGPAIFFSPDAYPGDRPAWVFRRMEDLQAIYLNTENFTMRELTPFAASIGEDWRPIPVELDPPLHGHFRAWLNPLFTPRKLAALDHTVRQTARALLAKFKARGECDFVAEFGFPLPVSVILDLLGLPQQKMEQFLEWEHSMMHALDFAEMASAVRATKSYLLDAIDRKRKAPGEDIISMALQAEVGGRAMTADEIFGLCFNLFVGGLDTVSTALGLHFKHLAENPADQATLRSDISLIPAALEELLRAYAPASTFRTCTKALEIGGVTLLPGDKIAMSPTLACRDPEAFAAPNEVQLARRPTHLAFGSGPHRCLGAALARRELQIAMEEVFAALPPFRLQPGARIEMTLGGIIRPTSLPLVWDN